MDQCLRFKKVLHTFKHLIKRSCSNYDISNTRKLEPPWRVLFFGSDDFSVASLEELLKEQVLYKTFFSKKGEFVNHLEVVTSLKLRTNVIRNFATAHNLRLHDWPLNLQPNLFDIGLVVSFGHLIPDDIINKFPLGMLNVHASLLPRWRGAAPIIFAIANGDTRTGVTIMKIKPKQFDIGEICLQECVHIPLEMKMPELYQELAQLGALNLVKCIKTLPESILRAKPQSDIGVTYAPKVNTSIANIQWNKLTALGVYNLERALTGLYNLSTTWNNIPVKLYGIIPADSALSAELEDNRVPGSLTYRKDKKVLQVLCCDEQWVTIKKIKVHGKPVMTATDFYNGYLHSQPLNLRIFR